MTVAQPALSGERVPNLAGHRDPRWHAASRTRNAERERAHRRRLTDACLFALTAAALMAAFWLSFGATS